MDHELFEQPINSYEAYRNVADNRGQAIKLEFRLKSGDAEQFEYSYLTRTSFNFPTGKIIMKFMDVIVTIEGNNLIRLKNELRHNKIEWVQEAESEFGNINSESVLIKKIELLI